MLATLRVSVKLVQQRLEAVRDALTDYVVVDALENVAEPALILTAEAAGLSYGGIDMHCRLWRMQISLGGLRLNGPAPHRFHPCALELAHFAGPAPGLLAKPFVPSPLI